MNEVRFLAWDSAFFGQKIGSLHLTDAEPAHVAPLLDEARSNGYQLVYVFANRPEQLTNNLLQRYGGHLVDTKLTYTQTVPTDVINPPNPAVRLINATDDRNVLDELACQSGEFSRFRVDSRFGDDAFRRFYRQWLDNSLTGAMADAVYVYILSATIGGFITVKKKPGLASIGLLATDEAVRGRGIGRALVNQVRQYVAASQLTTLEVVTQRANQTACRFYERMGFGLKETVWVYHCWL